MKTKLPFLASSRLGWLAVILSLALQANAQFVAYVDFLPGAGTHSNTTRWRPCEQGPGLCLPTNVTLLEITTGTPLGVALTISASGFPAPGGSAGIPAAGTPCYTTFNRFVDFSSTTIQTRTNDSLIYTFTGLNPDKEYGFKGTGIRGNNAYTNRWSVFEIVGADSFRSAHTANCLTSASGVGLTASQVAINTGINHTPATGDMAVWEDIEPGNDGTLAVTCTQYTGTVPGGTSVGAPYSYAIAGIRLEEFNRLRLKIRPDPATPGNLLISWSNEAAALQSTPNFNEGWNDVVGFGGSYSVTPLGTMFYRLRLGP